MKIAVPSRVIAKLKNVMPDQEVSGAQDFHILLFSLLVALNNPANIFH